MSSIADFFSSVLGKQDKALTALDEIRAELAAAKASATEKESTISKLTADLATATGKIVSLESARVELEAKHAEALKAKDAEVEKIAAAKALEITQKQGQPPLAMGTPPANPATTEQPKPDLKGIARVKAALEAESRK